jgi:hypothetical protein
MLTQAELYSNGEYRTFWVSHDPYNNDRFKVGSRLVLNEEPLTAFTVVGTFVSLGDDAVLPPKARKATISFLIEDEQERADLDLRTAYPKICVA